MNTHIITAALEGQRIIVGTDAQGRMYAVHQTCDFAENVWGFDERLYAPFEASAIDSWLRGWNDFDARAVRIVLRDAINA